MADPFRTRDHVPDFDRHVADYAARSAATRGRLRMLPEVAYGPSAEEKLDLFFPPPHLATGAVHLFIHGGYWRMFGKEDFSFIAETVVEAGAVAVIIGYALMPSVRMETVVEQVGRARDWIVRHIGGHGGDPARLTISGHSAGAHLGALLLDESGQGCGIASALLLSGIYDLAPLRDSFLKELIDLTDSEIARFSPLGRNYFERPNIRLLVGERETVPFHAQSKAFTARLATAGVSASHAVIAGADHMSIVADLGTPGTETADYLVRCITSHRLTPT